MMEFVPEWAPNLHPMVVHGHGRRHSRGQGLKFNGSGEGPKGDCPILESLEGKNETGRQLRK